MTPSISSAVSMVDSSLPQNFGAWRAGPLPGRGNGRRDPSCRWCLRLPRPGALAQESTRSRGLLSATNRPASYSEPSYESDAEPAQAPGADRRTRSNLPRDSFHLPEGGANARARQFLGRVMRKRTDGPRRYSLLLSNEFSRNQAIAGLDLFILISLRVKLRACGLSRAAARAHVPDLTRA